ncbi:uncharacterized protein LOC112486949 isoform X2 [Cynoglossus semilaevis]|uniref:Uncharacterized LOC112486949 n=2 Tax=Cynoglossus semilaevis TaxID=244447 RepID=A0A3P8V5H1_CYNSE|nr:uncharacterized protein LOC112486949 isoform X2 [Cynoglossus semilaevis]
MMADTICNDTFYFEDNIDGDSFTDSARCLTYKLQCKDNKYLFLNSDGEFRLQHMTIQEQCQLDCRFNIHLYSDSSRDQKQGIAVILYMKKDGRKLVVCCRRNNEIYSEAMELPYKIEDKAHKALFYLTKLTHDKFMFESSVFPSTFLGFEPVKDNPSLKKPVLHEKGFDGVGEDSEVILSKCH